MKAIRTLRPLLAGHPRVKDALRGADRMVRRWQHALAERVPALIRPAPRQLTVAITAACNLKCVGCRYGRDFMLGERLSLEMVKELLEDAAAAGVDRVRYYGGEPLLHPDLPAMVRLARERAMDVYVTTNAILLKERIDELYDAGLRWMTVGFYGTGEKYDAYTQREGHYRRLDESFRAVRERYGRRVDIQLNYVLLRPTTNLDALREAWEFARRYDLFFHLDLYSPSIPFFTDTSDEELRFRPEDRPAVQQVVDELLRYHEQEPWRFPQPRPFLRSVTDWLVLGTEMHVPCDAYELLWVGADGSVQLCDVTFKLGNLHRNRLREMLFGPEHRQASVDAFRLACPNCTCKCDSRIMKHAPSLRRYSHAAS